MNSSGWLRSIMAVHMEAEKFLTHVADIIGKEFEEDVFVLEILTIKTPNQFGQSHTNLVK